MLNIYKLKKNNIKNNIISKQGIIIKQYKNEFSLSKEWFNSVYSFNRNNQNFLTNLNINIYNIFKLYFNMFNLKLERSILHRRVSISNRSKKLNKIFLGKPEFKHTNDKVIVTLYVYNRELLLLTSKMKKLKRKILIEYFFKLFMSNKKMFTRIYLIKNTLNKINKLKKNIKKILFKNKKLFKKIKFYLSLKKTWQQFKNERFNKKTIYLAKSLKRLEKKLEKINFIKFNKNIFIWKYMNNIYTNDNKLNNLFTKSLIPKFKLSKLIYLNILKKIIFKIRLYLRYHKIIFFNKSKFSIHMMPLKKYIERLYKKKVEFNIINLKNYSLDSNILTQIMAIKLKNRKNRINRIIPLIMRKIKLPLTKKLEYSKKLPNLKLRQNIIVKNLVNNNVYDAVPSIEMKKTGIEVKQLDLIETNYDKLDIMLKVLYPIEYTMSKISKNIRYILKRDVKNITLENIENKIVSGVKVEGSGRLSKRITAAKSMSKIKQKGTLKNLNSSYKKLSSVLLRGNYKSNIQYTMINSKTRIGAFGVKGWVSSI